MAPDTARALLREHLSVPFGGTGGALWRAGQDPTVPYPELHRALQACRAEPFYPVMRKTSFLTGSVRAMVAEVEGTAESLLFVQTNYGALMTRMILAPTMLYRMAKEAIPVVMGAGPRSAFARALAELPDDDLRGLFPSPFFAGPPVPSPDQFRHDLLRAANAWSPPTRAST